MPVAHVIWRSMVTAICVALLCWSDLSYLGTTYGASKTSATTGATALDSATAIERGESLERSREWLRAIELYETAVEDWPENKELQLGLRRSRIHFSIERRYNDISFQKELLQLTRNEALNLFDDVLARVRSNYVDPVSSTSFVAHGTESLYLALANPKYLEKNLPGVSPDRVRSIRSALREQYWNRPLTNQAEARAVVNDICQISEESAGLSSGAVVMEYIFGGCNVLDDYSSVLTPERLKDLYSNIQGEFVGLGIEMKAEIGKGLLLVNVLSESPAAEGGLNADDHILSIDGTDCRYLSTEVAANLLRGDPMSRVTLEVHRADTKETETLVLQRRAVHVKSIPVVKMLDRDAGVGYIQMTGFQVTSAQEMDDALRTLHQQGMRALIWDLRGNPGGLLTAAVEVLDRFIDHGVLVSTKGRTSDQNRNYSAYRAQTWNLPIVLLVDGDSASASEIVAGALNDYHRGTIVGRPTYGKWSVQTIIDIRGGSGIRLTTAKFYSPHGRTLGKIGVRPDIVVPTPEEKRLIYKGLPRQKWTDDPDIQEGLRVLQKQIASS
ncbi:MAG: S41 family peptidase [Planctomycetota bacterium]|nr:S41 family peptidase [Planctomycetota bacterium]MDA1212864.1 S41 family peptidase [Planctomycetota bacterium]